MDFLTKNIELKPSRVANLRSGAGGLAQFSNGKKILVSSATLSYGLMTTRVVLQSASASQLKQTCQIHRWGLFRSSHLWRGPFHRLTLGLTPPVPWPNVQSGTTESVLP